MAQLLKIDDCHSRYQQDVITYANRFIQLKEKRWSQWEEAWKNPSAAILPSVKKQVRHASTMADLKSQFHHFINEQKILWATSTTSSISDVPENYLVEPWFILSLRAFSDMTFNFYKPTLEIHNGLTQLETVLISPSAIWCLKGYYGEKDSVFQGLNDRTWQELGSKEVVRRLSPVVSLKHTYKVVKAMMIKAEIALPVHAALVVPESYVEFVDHDTIVRVIDKRNLSEWLNHFTMKHSTFKHDQLKAAQFLLNKTHTVSRDRL